MAAMYEPLLLSPPIPVEWAGFESDTRRMQACGWEFQLDTLPYALRRRVAAHHPRFNTVLYAELDDRDVERRALVYQHGDFRDYRGPPVRFMGAAHPHNFHMSFYDTPKWTAVDMSPQVVDIHTWSGTAADLFRRWAPESKEIIVEPETVADLFERIKQLQSPELAAIRERNRTREYDPSQRQEQVVAQVITLAA